MNIRHHDHDIEQAISFLVDAIRMYGHNPKPVILHSIRVGMRLYEHNYPKDLVIAALLHDVLEDSDVKKSAITKRFGPRITRLVESNSFNERIDDWVQSYQENFKRCRRAGKRAMIIKAADILDNSHYCCFDGAGRANLRWIKKMEYFIDLAAGVIDKEAIYRDLANNYKAVLTRMNTKL